MNKQKAVCNYCGEETSVWIMLRTPNSIEICCLGCFMKKINEYDKDND